MVVCVHAFLAVAHRVVYCHFLTGLNEGGQRPEQTGT